jgi:hypothetical protein
LELKKIDENVKDMTKTNNSKELMDLYVSALNEFNALIEQGYTKPRGYNLQTIDEIGFPPSFNERNINYKNEKDMNEKKIDIDIDYIKEELDKAVRIYKPTGDFGWGTLYNIAIHFYELGVNDAHK